MKKIVTTTLITSALLAFASTSFAVGTADAQSFAAAGVSTSSYSAGNGFSAQSAEAGAWNASYAGTYEVTDTDVTVGGNFSNWTITHESQTDAAAFTGSKGGSYSSVSGINAGNAFGSSVAGAGQFGSGEAGVVAGNPYGFLSIGSESSVSSNSFAANINNGFAINGTLVGAKNLTIASVGGSTTIGGQFFLPTTYAGVASNGSTYSVSADFDISAIGVTGGSANQVGGGGIAIAP